ncbi:hypothetical protein P8R55_08910 [Lactobacillus johnsonii]
MIGKAPSNISINIKYETSTDLPEPGLPTIKAPVEPRIGISKLSKLIEQ